jgi:K+-transporting ATPase ATPase C chain
MLSDFLRQCRPTLAIFVALTLLTGVLYPLAVTGLAALLFPGPASGNLIVQDGKVVGSRWIGQPFAADRYFWSRPSATGPYSYNGGASSGSNLGPTNPALLDAVRERVAALRASHPEQKGDVPIDLVTASASGLDPHISPAAAYYQVERVAAARGLSADQVRQLVDQQTEQRTLGVLGEPRVNVLMLNLGLDIFQEPKNRRTD